MCAKGLEGRKQHTPSPQPACPGLGIWLRPTAPAAAHGEGHAGFRRLLPCCSACVSWSAGHTEVSLVLALGRGAEKGTSRIRSCLCEEAPWCTSFSH